MQSPLDNFDPLRDGLRNLKEQCRSGHEVEQMQKEVCTLAHSFNTTTSLKG